MGIEGSNDNIESQQQAPISNPKQKGMLEKTKDFFNGVKEQIGRSFHTPGLNQQEGKGFSKQGSEYAREQMNKAAPNVGKAINERQAAIDELSR